VRLSGAAVPAVAQALLGRLPAPRHATYGAFRDAAGAAIDYGVALFFPSPHSFTGEDVLELHGHGGPLVMDLLLRRVVELGAQLARPGEFSERAFLNGKLDLAQAEAIADLIEASSETAARSALRSLEGRFSQQVRQIVESLINLRAYVEASIDFTDEEVDFLSDETVERRLVSILEALAALLDAARQGCLLHDGMTVVLAGPPNAGKSSLLNSLAQRETAIVSAIPGTTRDVLREQILIDGMPLHVLDTAGLRDSSDEIESEGVRRAYAAMQRADRVLLIIDDAAKRDVAIERLVRQLPPGRAYTLVRNKVDLSGRHAGLHVGTSAPEVALSARTGAGLGALCAHLRACMGFQVAGEGSFIARRRHLDAIERAREHVQRAGEQLSGAHAGELMAEDLRLAQRALGEITGEFTSEDLLGRIFSSFCIGK
jgi:tRNA modification GTPase